MPPSEEDRWIADAKRRQQERDLEGPMQASERKLYAKRIEQLGHALKKEQQAHANTRALLAKSSSPGRRHLVIPDAHADLAEEPNDRFTWLARMAKDRKPDVVINLGDAVDFGSLCTYEKPGSLAAQGRDYKGDVESGWDAFKRMTPKATKSWKPRLIALTGNHEDRVDRFRNQDVRMGSMVSLKDIGREDLGWEVVPFEVPHVVDDIAYCHYLARVGGRYPIAGKYAANSLLAEGHMSTVVGHSHMRDHKEARTWSGGKLFSLVAGCFFERPHHWAGTSNDAWWRGVFEIEDIRDGYGHVIPWPLEKVKATYG